MTSLPAAVTAGLGDGVARVGADGALTPCNDAMRTMCERAAAGATPVTLATLGVDAGHAAALQDGDVVRVCVRGESLDLRLVRERDNDWLVATDATAAEHAVASTLELVRLRALALAANGVVHDLNNLLNAALGLAAQLDPFVRSDAERKLLHDLARGTQSGAQLLRAVARLLARPRRDREAVAVSAIVEDTMALVAKAAATRGVQVAIDAPAERVVARTVATDAVQALWHGAMSVLDRGPRQLAIAIDRVQVPLAPARTRTWARVRVSAVGIEPAAAREVAAVVAGDVGLLASCARSPLAAGLATAVFAQRRLGGDLVASAQDDRIELEYRWPAVT